MKTQLLTFNFEEHDGLSREAEPVLCRFCVDQGEAGGSSETLSIIDIGNGTPVFEAVVEILSKWPDDTIRWISVELPVSIDAHDRRAFALISDDGDIPCKDELAASEAPPFSYELTETAPVLRVLDHKNSDKDTVKEVLHLRPYIVSSDDVRHVLDVVAIDEQSPSTSFHRRVQLSASDSLSKLDGLTLSVALDIFPDTGLIEVELCIHNPAAAHHRGGVWDAGDPSSIHFREIGFEIHHPEGQLISVESFDDGKRLSTESVSELHVEQSSSREDCGWIACGKKLSGEYCELAQGSRITPVASVVLANGLLTLHVPRFWQEHPSALHLTTSLTIVALFAESASGNHELQPGERKRRRLSMHVGASGHEPKRWLASRLQPPCVSGPIEPAKEHFNRAVVLQGNFDEALASLVVSPQEFFAKRECIDEFGWRDFGEVFADHESLYLHSGEPPLVSHYNNQYDLVLGFGLQFLRTKDSRWYELMEDLARHVSDIDIYHTVEDRIEYNHGLFWHTNHYQNAGTATHRTFSILNYDPADPSGSSGGPGPEHCYTSGLALHFLLSGDSASREAVMGLANWVRDYFRGDDTLLGRIHSIARCEVPHVIALLQRRARVNYTYPLTRATGNLIVSFLDAHLLSEDREWLDAVEAVLENVFHPDDDVTARDLDNVEAAWSHTIFLQAVLRYLATKEALGEQDARHEFARQAFLTYTKWTLEFADPYLEMPDSLEFANDTWAAQDIRRAILMVAAAAYDSSSADAYLAKAERFSEHLLEILRSSGTLQYARIQAIIMQNLGIASLYEGRPITGSYSSNRAALPAKKHSTIRGELRSALTKLLHGLRNFDARAEIHWLRTRR